MNPTPDQAGNAIAAVPLFVVPCLNEAAHIIGLLDQLSGVQKRLGGLIVVVDGGSIDGTREIAQAAADVNPAVRFLDNPERIQSAGINRAVRAFGDGATHLLRIDAHCTYPDDFADRLLEDAARTGAASVVVSMFAAGDGIVQRVNAASQNAPVGNGGSPHRNAAQGSDVEHGHHALMQVAAFREVGGYDPRFTHNEDAELDLRLRGAGHRIWLTARTSVTYFPRQTIPALARQYFNYGRGRAHNFLKHRMRPGLRQIKVMAVAPALALVVLMPLLHPVFGLPALLWAGLCVILGLRVASRARDPSLVLVVMSSMVMHVAWSLGFWARILSPTPAQPLGAPS